MKGKGRPTETEEPNVFDKLERAISKKLKIANDLGDRDAMRKAAMRSLRLNKGEMAKAIQTKTDLARLELHDRKLHDLEVIESQYTTYFRNISWKNNYHRTDEEKSGFEALIEKSNMSQEAKGLLKLKARTPFRINLEDFDNLDHNVGKYYSMIGFDNMKAKKLEASFVTSERNLKTEVGEKVASNDDPLNSGRFITQPSFMDPIDYFNTNSDSLLKFQKEKSKLVAEATKEKSWTLKPKEVVRKKFFQTAGVKDDLDKVSTKYTNQTTRISNQSEYFSTSDVTPQRGFLIKRSFKPVRYTSRRDIQHLSERFDQLSSLCTEESSRIFTIHQGTRPMGEGSPRHKDLSRTQLRHSTIVKGESSKFSQTQESYNQDLVKGFQETILENHRSRTIVNPSGGNSPQGKIKRLSKKHADDNSHEYYNTLAEYIDGFIKNAEKQPRSQLKYFYKKPFKKLDTREKMELEVKKMFESESKRPGGKTAALLANMLHHYIAFGNPLASKMEVTHKVKEFMVKHKVKISMEELKKLAAEKHFYITATE